MEADCSMHSRQLTSSEQEAVLESVTAVPWSGGMNQSDVATDGQSVSLGV
jgi:hypothetical protein